MLPVQTGNKAPNAFWQWLCEDVLSAVQERTCQAKFKLLDSGLTITPPGKAKLQFQGKLQKVKISGSIEMTEKYVSIDGCIYLQLNLPRVANDALGRFANQTSATGSACMRFWLFCSKAAKKLMFWKEKK